MTTIMANVNNTNDFMYNGGDFKDTRGIRQGWFTHKNSSSKLWKVKQDMPGIFTELKSWKRFYRRKEEKGSSKRKAYKLF